MAIQNRRGAFRKWVLSSYSLPRKEAVAKYNQLWPADYYIHIREMPAPPPPGTTSSSRE